MNPIVIGLKITGESGSPDEAIEMIKIKRPDIVLLDINLADASGSSPFPYITRRPLPKKYCSWMPNVM